MAETSTQSTWFTRILRPWLRAIHRDFGYVVVGLTFIYALSGLAVNHIADWDPNFTSFQREIPLQRPLPSDDRQAVEQVLSQLGISETPRSFYRSSPTLLDISLRRETIHVLQDRRVIVHDGQKPRFLLRAANWLHLNRGKKAWTIIADTYAVILLFLALSGTVMLPGKKGFFGRGGLLITAGALIPVLYVSLSGGP